MSSIDCTVEVKLSSTFPSPHLLSTRPAQFTFVESTSELPTSLCSKRNAEANLQTPQFALSRFLSLFSLMTCFNALRRERIVLRPVVHQLHTYQR